MDELSVAVVGAGVVGLATAVALADLGDQVAVIERHPSFGRETSSRNSEVIHAGLYYPPGSLKARLCAEGRRLLLDRCRAHRIPHALPGKLVVAAEAAELPVLDELLATGTANGAEGLVLLDAADVARLEPSVRGVAALHSPGTGIVDTHSLMADLHREAAAAGVMFGWGSEVTALELVTGGWVVGLADGYRFRARAVVNASGLQADRVAALAGIDPDAAGCRLRYLKGSYFACDGPSPVSRLVYPVPHGNRGVLGVHATLDLAGRLRFGPDAEPVLEPDYTVDDRKRDTFFESASRLIGGLSRERFRPDMAGVRPHLAGEGFRDFVIREESDRGLPGLVNLVGIESPGLTAAPAIGRMAATLAGRDL